MTVGYLEFQYNMTTGAITYTDEVLLDYPTSTQVNATDVSVFNNDAGYISDYVDTSASVNCSTSSVFLGNGSCRDSELFFDDTDTSAETECAGAQIYLGNGTCVPEANYADTDTTYSAGSNLTLTDTTFDIDFSEILSWLQGIFFDDESDLTTLLDDNYADIQWDYNQTTGANTYTDEQILTKDECSEITGCVENAVQNLDNVAFLNDTGTQNFAGNISTSGSINVTDYIIIGGNGIIYYNGSDTIWD